MHLTLRRSTFSTWMDRWLIIRSRPGRETLTWKRAEHWTRTCSWLWRAQTSYPIRMRSITRSRHCQLSGTRSWSLKPPQGTWHPFEQRKRCPNLAGRWQEGEHTSMSLRVRNRHQAPQQSKTDSTIWGGVIPSMLRCKAVSRASKILKLLEMNAQTILTLTRLCTIWNMIIKT